MMMIKEQLVDLLRADWDFVSACEKAELILAEVRASDREEVRFHTPSYDFTIDRKRP